MRSTITRHPDILTKISSGDAEAVRRVLTENVAHSRRNVQAVISEALDRAKASRTG